METSELYDLLNEYCDGRLSVSRREKLSEILVNSSEARALYWKYMYQQSMMRDSLSDANILENIRNESKLCVANREPKRDRNSKIIVYQNTKNKPAAPARVRRKKRSASATANALVPIAAGLMIVVGLLFIITLNKSSNESQLAKTKTPKTIVIKREIPVQQALPARDKPVQEVVPQKPLPVISKINQQNKTRPIENIKEIAPPASVRPIQPGELPLVVLDNPADLNTSVKISQVSPSESNEDQTESLKPLETESGIIASFNVFSKGVSVIRNGKKIKLKSNYEEIHVHDTLVTSEKGYGELMYDDDYTTLTLLPNTTIKMLALKKGKKVHVENGVVRASVQKQKKDQPMLLKTHNSVVTVLGTRFTLSAGASASQIRMKEGEVEVQNKKGEKVAVRAGYMLNVEDAEAMKPERISLTGMEYTSAYKNLVQLYVFQKELNSGRKVNDLSKMLPKVDLYLRNADKDHWKTNGGLDMDGSFIAESIGDCRKTFQAIEKTNELTLEVWLKPHESFATTDALHLRRLCTFAESHVARNFSFSISCEMIETWLRTDRTNKYGVYLEDKGMPNRHRYKYKYSKIKKFPKDIAHLVISRNNQGLMQYFINGELQFKRELPGMIKDWNKKFKFIIGNERNGENPLKGVYYMLAVYNKALSENEVYNNFIYGTP